MSWGFRDTSGKRLLAAVSSVALMLTPVLVSAEEGEIETGDVAATGTGAAGGVSVAQGQAEGGVATGAYVAGGAAVLGAGLCIAFCDSGSGGGSTSTSTSTSPQTK